MLCYVCLKMYISIYFEKRLERAIILQQNLGVTNAEISKFRAIFKIAQIGHIF